VSAFFKNPMLFFIVGSGSYFIGSLPTAYLIGKLKNIDIRKLGSGNVGATNTFRTMGKKEGTIVLITDILKGFIPAFGIHIYFNSSPDEIYFLLLSGIFTVLGHIFPVWLKFKGGKGVATACGMLLAIAPGQTIIAMVIFFSTLVFTKFVSLGSILGVLSLPFTFFLFHEYSNDSRPLFIFLTSITLLVILKHKINIQKLWQGTESKISRFAR
jgi:glycerol-3-phosphate acyltransferase PlsY